MREMRVGVVGLGWAAGAHIEAFKHVQGAQVTAVCSRRRRDPAQLETKYGPAAIRRSWRRSTASP